MRTTSKSILCAIALALGSCSPAKETHAAVVTSFCVGSHQVPSPVQPVAQAPRPNVYCVLEWVALPNDPILNLNWNTTLNCLAVAIPGGCSGLPNPPGPTFYGGFVWTSPPDLTVPSGAPGGPSAQYVYIGWNCNPGMRFSASAIVAWTDINAYGDPQGQGYPSSDSGRIGISPGCVNP